MFSVTFLIDSNECNEEITMPDVLNPLGDYFNEVCVIHVGNIPLSMMQMYDEIIDNFDDSDHQPSLPDNVFQINNVNTLKFMAGSFLSRKATKFIVFTNPNSTLYQELCPYLDIFPNLKENQQLQFRTLQNFMALNDQEMKKIMSKVLIPSKVELGVMKQVLKKQLEKFKQSPE